ncbi:hypothetical protein H6501_05835 [Candidatus Woesearchaeota archaeon]|nr:hypothetical protein [Nanoarchaeota archaeon]MCB9371094.1 hypothetical protein [Candidatus Woesearchaeota archaeon]USN44189.1 MAG: hypothetical protein H6500_07415 [Candidatus Woesearchaeota archaeon]
MSEFFLEASYALLHALDSGIFWIIIPIFFIGIITDKYQEAKGTSIGNAITNGTFIIFSAFSWLQIIFSREGVPHSFQLSQTLFSFMAIIYGYLIIASGFKTGKFAVKYGRIRVVTYTLLYFTTMVYIPTLYTFKVLLFYCLFFPLYYAAMSKFINLLPEIKASTYNKAITDSKIANISRARMRRKLRNLFGVKEK